MQNYLPACKIVSTHGVRGEMKALPLCDGVQFLAKFKRLYAAANGSGEVALRGVRAQGNMLLVKLAGVEDMDAARLMGINVNSTISFTFAVGSALAGIGSVLYCCSYPQATPTMGSMLGLKAFVAAVLGGIGSIPGAVIGGLIVGFAEVFVSAIGLSVWQDAVVFLLLIIVLIVKPTGLLGRPMTEKV